MRIRQLSALVESAAGKSRYGLKEELEDRLVRVEQNDRLPSGPQRENELNLCLCSSNWKISTLAQTLFLAAAMGNPLRT